MSALCSTIAILFCALTLSGLKICGDGGIWHPPPKIFPLPEKFTNDCNQVNRISSTHGIHLCE